MKAERAHSLSALVAQSRTPDGLASALVQHFDRQPFDDIEVQQPCGGVKVQRMAAAPATLLGFADAIGFEKADVHAWATAVDGDGQPAYPAFAAAYREAQRVQARRIQEGIALGLYVDAAVPLLMRECAWQPQPALNSAASA